MFDTLSINHGASQSPVHVLNDSMSSTKTYLQLIQFEYKANQIKAIWGTLTLEPDQAPFDSTFP